MSAAATESLGSEAPSKKLSPADLMARGIAPVKPVYLMAQAARQQVEALAGAARHSEAMNKKSKRQMKKERAEASRDDLCTNFALGRCSFGATCKFSHDLTTYLAAKPPDLAGSCPFTCLPTCPYGVTCRWATKHRPPSNGASTTSGSTTVLDPSATAPGAAAGFDLEAASSWSPGCLLGSLPVSQEVAAPCNSISKELQGLLRRDAVDFSRADGVMRSLGLQPGTGKSRGKRQQAGRQQQQRGGRQQQEESKKVTTAGLAPQGGQVGAADDGYAGDGQEPAAKKMKVEQVQAAVVADREQQTAAEAAAAGAGPVPGPGAPAATQATAGGDPTSSTEFSGIPSGGGGRGPDGEGNPLALSSKVLELDAFYEGQPDKVGMAAAQAGAACHEPGGEREAEANLAMAGLCEAAGGVGQQDPSVAAAADRAAAVGLYVEGRSPGCERRRQLDLAGKTYLAPLTTVGNLPFRRLAKSLGADVTCGEMALATNLLQGQASEWALLKRHPCEDLFGVQVCGGYPDAMSRLAQLLEEHTTVDFVDINCGCPIDIICKRGAGSALATKPQRLKEVVTSMSSILSVPLTVKIRKGYYDNSPPTAHTLIPQLAEWGAAAVTLHGRTRQQRYSRSADWDYIRQCAAAAGEMPLVGNGDVFSYQDWAAHMDGGGVATCMIGRAALIKPWIFTEIKEQRVWDISAGERLGLLRDFVAHGLEHWGSDMRGVETTRRFLLEWLSFTHRYIPVGLLEVVPQQMQWRPPAYRGRNQLETLLASDSGADWVRISEMLLGPAPEGFVFTPKHKTNSYVLSVDEMAGMMEPGEGGTGRQAAEEGEENG